MISLDIIRPLAFKLDEVKEEPHFDKISFRVKNKIFATVDTKKLLTVLKLSEIDQSVFSNFDKTVIYPVPGTWGRLGWTIFEMKRVRKDMFGDALILAYCNVAPAKLSSKYRIQ